jgi:transcriptional regulator with XRE-family HTH domain
MPITSRTCRAARGLLGWSQAKLAAKANVSIGTVQNVEAGKVMTPATLTLLQMALEGAGVEFLNAESPGVRLRKQGGA